MVEKRIELSTLLYLFKALHIQQFSKHLQLQQKRTNVRALKNNNNGIFIEVTKNSGAFAKQCAPSFNDLPV